MRLPAYVPATLPPFCGLGCTGLEQTHKCALTIFNFHYFLTSESGAYPRTSTSTRPRSYCALRQKPPPSVHPPDLVFSSSEFPVKQVVETDSPNGRVHTPQSSEILPPRLRQNRTLKCSPRSGLRRRRLALTKIRPPPLLPLFLAAPRFLTRGCLFGGGSPQTPAIGQGPKIGRAFGADDEKAPTGCPSGSPSEGGRGSPESQPPLFTTDAPAH